VASKDQSEGSLKMLEDQFREQEQEKESVYMMPTSQN
jgi:hypothetical protein